MTSLGTPGMSDACQANTSTFAHRKVTSASSYFLSRAELMVKAPPVPPSLTETFLVPGGVALDLLFLPAELSGTSSMGARHSEEVCLQEWVSEVSPIFSFPVELSGTSSTGAHHSEEVRLPEWAPEVSSVIFFFPPGAPVAGASAPVAAVAATACWYNWSVQISASFLSEGMVMIVTGPGIFRVL